MRVAVFVLICGLSFGGDLKDTLEGSGLRIRRAPLTTAT